MKKFLFVIVVGGFFCACKKQAANDSGNSVDCSGPAKSFATEVHPIIQASCARSGCHGAGSSNGPGALLTYSQVFNARSSIHSAVSSGRMPLSGSLTTSQKNAILCWIDNGAPDN